jgi:uncharacterized protein YciI
MQFLIIAHDGEDDQALTRRLAAREQHLALSNTGVETGEQLVGAAILDDAGKMRGSVMIVDYPSRKEVDEWLKREPYVTGGVWKKIEVLPCKVGPSFGHIVKQK